jgi:hypothetical protein
MYDQETYKEIKICCDCCQHATINFIDLDLLTCGGQIVSNTGVCKNFKPFVLDNH